MSTEDALYLSERRRVVSWYNGAGWVTYQTTCPTCSRPMVVCNADVRGCGSGQAGATEDYNPVPPKRSFEVQVEYEYRGRGTPAPYPIVSLPTEPDTHEPVLEDTQAAPNEWDVCPKCKFVTLYCACAS